LSGLLPIQLCGASVAAAHEADRPAAARSGQAARVFGKLKFPTFTTSAEAAAALRAG
jgi:hypothetical protein